MAREWNTPIREPWNPVIKKCLHAIDTHMRMYIQTGDDWHLSKADTLRNYVKDLKVWILAHEEMKDEYNITEGSNPKGSQELR